MNPICTLLTNPDGAAGAADARHDVRQRAIVDDGIALMRVAGTLSALEYLKSHAVTGQVILRVLLEPARRRADSAFAAA